MAESVAQICNLALRHLGQGVQIASISENSSAARAMNAFYLPALEATLRDFPWTFARKVADLTQLEEDPTTEWGYSYTYPPDCLEAIRIVTGNRNDSPQTRVPFQIFYGDDSSEIYTDEDDAALEYTVRVTDVLRFPPDFVFAFSWRLAAYAASSITAGDPFGLATKCLQMYAIELSKAKANANNEQRPDLEVDSEFVRARNG